MDSETLSSLDRFIKFSFVSFVFVFIFIMGGVKGRGRVEKGKIVAFYIGLININLLFLNNQTR
jgi:hypothetical protein